MIQVQYDAVDQVVDVQSALPALPSVVPGMVHYALGASPATTDDTDAPTPAPDSTPVPEPDAPFGEKQVADNGWDALSEHPIGGVRLLHTSVDITIVDTAEGPGGWRQSYEYDANGNLLQQERTCDGVTTYTYNESDKPIATRWPGGYESTLSYNVQNQLSVYTTVTGGEIRYHPTGEIAEIEQADGTVKRYAYNGIGRTTESVDPAGIVTPYEYDALARVTAMNCAHRPRVPDRGTSRATWPTRARAATHFAKLLQFCYN